MKKSLLNIVMLLTSLASLPASAALYNFSYTFDDGAAITGSLTGDLVDGFVQNVGDVQVNFNGIPFAGPLLAVNYSPLTRRWDSTVNATVSVLGSLNNFLFVDANSWIDSSQMWSVGDTGLFYMINNRFQRSAYALLSSPALMLSASDELRPVYFDGIGAKWSLTLANPVSAVPEPETYTMLLVGLGLIGFTARRRKDLDA